MCFFGGGGGGGGAGIVCDQWLAPQSFVCSECSGATVIGPLILLAVLHLQSIENGLCIRSCSNC